MNEAKEVASSELGRTIPVELTEEQYNFFCNNDGLSHHGFWLNFYTQHGVDVGEDGKEGSKVLISVDGGQPFEISASKTDFGTTIKPKKVT